MTEWLIETPNSTKFPEEKRQAITKALNSALEPFAKDAKVWIEAKDQTYNGWTNWETWAVCLWLQNDQGIDHTARRLVRQNISEADKADKVKDFTYTLVHPEAGTPYITDDISLYRVNWREVVGALEEE